MIRISELHFFNNNEYTSDNNTSIFFTFKTGISAGYNGKKYFGLAYRYDTNREKFENGEITQNPIQNNFHLFWGYRFKAPK